MNIVHRTQFSVLRKTDNRAAVGEPRLWREQTTVNSKFAGFTLIELLVAITIIAILIGAGTYTWINGQEKGRDGKRKNELKEVQKALELYAHAEGAFPLSQNGKIFCKINSADATATEISWGSEFVCDNTTFMQKLPKDPNGSINYYYFAVAPGGIATNYIIWSNLENKKDPDYCDGIQCFSAVLNLLPACQSPPYCDFINVMNTHHYFVINQ